MMRQIMALFDEYQSKENAKYPPRVLKENARQGFWNGSLPPIDYRVVAAAEQRRVKVEKKLEINPLHADMVRLIYRLALEDDGASGPMGVKNIASHLDGRRIFHPRRRTLGHRPGSSHPDTHDLYRTPRVQQAQQDEGTEAGRRDRPRRGSSPDQSVPRSTLRKRTCDRAIRR